MKLNSIEQFKAARRVSVPIVSWHTPDPAATIEQVKQALNGALETTPMAKWDVSAGTRRITTCCLIPESAAIGNPEDAIAAARSSIKKDGIFFMLQMHRHIDKGVAQAIWNLRDAWKAGDAGNMLIMLSPSMQLPSELAGDVVVIDEELPDAAQLESIVAEQYKNVQLPLPKGQPLARVVDALTGLHAYGAEQALAMSFQRTAGKGSPFALNSDALWQRKRQAIERTRGLTVNSEPLTFKDVAGVGNVLSFITAIINGRRPMRGVIHLDELEKSMAGAQSDSSGTTQDQLGCLLQEMEDKNAMGLLFVGHPGSAKSLVAKATSGQAGVLGMRLDLGGLKAKNVGDSEENIRAAMKVINSVTQGQALFIATINKLDVIPPELQRRFTLGTFFFDLPSDEERAALWTMYRARFEIAKGDKGVHDDAGWTGSDIKNCCERAWMMATTLEAAAKFATPVARTRPQQIEYLCSVANGAFISASYEGVYEQGKRQETQQPQASRRMRD